MYRTWAREQGIAEDRHPKEAAHLSHEQPGFKHPTMSAGTDSSALVITFPDNGDIFKMDPILRRSYQTVKLEVVAPPTVEQVIRMVDDQLFAEVKAPFTARWPLEPGRHALHVTTSGCNPPLHSRTVHILVLDR